MTLDRDHLPAVDPRISLGSVLSIVSMAVGLALAWANLSAANAEQRVQLVAIQRQLDHAAQDHDELVQLASDVRSLMREREQRLGIKPELDKP